MSDNGIEITTPVGRIVWGHPTKAKQKIDQDTNQPVFKDGQPVLEWSFGLAIPRAEFEASVWPYMHQEACKGYPSGTFPPKFSWKMTDGDKDIDPKGIPYSQREGHAGHMILAVNTVFQAPGVFKLEGGVYRQMGGDEIKCGDYVRVGINFKVNVPAKVTHTPSLYVNPLAIEFVGYGAEIKTGFVADPKAMFGGQAVALPAGASATPVGGAPAASMPGMGGMPGAPAAPAPVMAPPPPVAPPPPAGPQRPTDPTHIHEPGTPGEQWYINGAWMPAPAAPAQPVAPPPPPAALPPPAAGFASPGGMPAAPMPGQMPSR